MTALTVTVPDDLANDLEDAGLLRPDASDALEAILRESLRRFHLRELLRDADRLEAAKFPRMTMDEIQAEVNAVRAERRRRAPNSLWTKSRGVRRAMHPG